MQARLMAAQLVGLRITSGITDEEMASRMGLIPANVRRTKKMVAEAVQKLREIEVGLSDGRLSTIQRYTRCIGTGLGAKFDVRLVRPYRPALRIHARLLRRGRRAMLKRLQRPRRRFIV